MDVASSRFAPAINPCPACGKAKLIPVVGLHGVQAVEAEPHKDGNILLRDTGAPHPLATRLTTAQQFGRQGQLHRVHGCPKKGRRGR